MVIRCGSSLCFWWFFGCSSRTKCAPLPPSWLPRPGVHATPYIIKWRSKPRYVMFSHPKNFFFFFFASSIYTKPQLYSGRIATTINTVRVVINLPVSSDEERDLIRLLRVLIMIASLVISVLFQPRRGNSSRCRETWKICGKTFLWLSSSNEALIYLGCDNSCLLTGGLYLVGVSGVLYKKFSPLTSTTSSCKLGNLLTCANALSVESFADSHEPDDGFY